MKSWKKAVVTVLGVVMLVVVGIGASVQLRYDRVFDVPEVALSASTDPAVIEQGRYLSYGPAHCAYCHTPIEAWPAIDAGEEPPMSGGVPFVTPLATIHSANITPDVETGIGAVTDGQLARMLRHNVKRDGRAAIPFMEFYELSDADVVAILSYLRATEPARNEVPATRFTALGKAIMAFAIVPGGPTDTPPATSPPEDGSILRGAYLANSVAGCAGCHSQRDLRDGSYIGPRFAGGMAMEMEDDPTRVFVTPNLTPDPAYGIIADWTVDQFVQRFRAGALVPGSHMPWGAYQRMSDDDLLAVHRYLMTLDPVRFDPGPSIQPKP